ncbi:MAG: hypothetical protein ABIH89_10165 [Elusimicrobiota bacterium]
MQNEKEKFMRIRIYWIAAITAIILCLAFCGEQVMVGVRKKILRKRQAETEAKKDIQVIKVYGSDGYSPEGMPNRMEFLKNTIVKVLGREEQKDPAESLHCSVHFMPSDGDSVMTGLLFGTVFRLQWVIYDGKNIDAKIKVCKLSDLTEAEYSALSDDERLYWKDWTAAWQTFNGMLGRVVLYDKAGNIIDDISPGTRGSFRVVFGNSVRLRFMLYSEKVDSPSPEEVGRIGLYIAENLIANRNDYLINFDEQERQRKFDMLGGVR